MTERAARRERPLWDMVFRDYLEHHHIRVLFDLYDIAIIDADDYEAALAVGCARVTNEFDFLDRRAIAVTVDD